jgi:3-deoxy-7-phosphoheptulonate synthase
VEEAGHPVVWVCDPMHGNTFNSPSGRKTRHFDAIIKQLEKAMQAHTLDNTQLIGTYEKARK